MKFIIRKVIEAKDVYEALKKDKKIKPMDVYLADAEFQEQSKPLVKEEVKPVGFKK